MSLVALLECSHFFPPSFFLSFFYLARVVGFQRFIRLNQFLSRCRPLPVLPSFWFFKGTTRKFSDFTVRKTTTVFVCVSFLSFDAFVFDPPPPVAQIPYVVIAEQSKTLYKKTLETFAGANPILTVDQKSTLDKMAAFLSMEPSAVTDIHAEVRVTSLFL